MARFNGSATKLRKTGVCKKCGEILYGNDWGAASAHWCPKAKRPKAKKTDPGVSSPENATVHPAKNGNPEGGTPGL